MHLPIDADAPGFQQEIAHLAHRALTTGRLRNEMRARFHARMRIRDGDREP